MIKSALFALVLGVAACGCAGPQRAQTTSAPIPTGTEYVLASEQGGECRPGQLVRTGAHSFAECRGQVDISTEECRTHSGTGEVQCRPTDPRRR